MVDRGFASQRSFGLWNAQSPVPILRARCSGQSFVERPLSTSCQAGRSILQSCSISYSGTEWRDIMTKPISPLPVCIVLGLAIIGHADIASADTCAASTVTARGEESRFAWLAKTKARANWRAKVRATTGLGPDYANWARARDTEEHCLTGGSGTVCRFTGTPCRP